jgi:hypothetical protein
MFINVNFVYEFSRHPFSNIKRPNMPSRRSGSSRVTRRIVARPARSRARNVTTVSVAAVPRRSRRQARARAPVRGASQAVVSTLLQAPTDLGRMLIDAYVKTLNDPFSYGAVKLGFGTFTGSTVATAFQRFIFQMASDGTMGFVMWPTVGANGGYTCSYNTNGATSNSWTPNSSYSYPNESTLNALFAEGRVVSGGIRAYPMIAGTLAPGLVYAGACPDSNHTSFNNNETINSLIGEPYLHAGPAPYGAQALIRPLDNDSFAMTTASIIGYATNQLSFNSNPVIAFTNCSTQNTSTTTNVLIEMVVNVEGDYDNFSVASAISGPRLGDQDDQLSNYFPSIESVWGAVRKLLAPAGCVFASEAAPHSAAQRAAHHSFRMPLRSQRVNSSNASQYASSEDRSSTTADRQDYFVVPTVNPLQNRPPPRSPPPHPVITSFPAITQEERASMRAQALANLAAAGR